MRKIKVYLFVLLLLVSLNYGFTQESDSSIYMDFRNQKITDIIYSVAEVCGKSVFIDETVTGSATFRFEDKDFESAMARFTRHCQLYVENNEGVYFISKVRIENKSNDRLSINTENVQIEPFINMLSRFTNRTILFDNLPNAMITIRVTDASLEDVLNLTIVKLPGFGLERIADGYYITRSSGNMNKRNIDVFTMSDVDGKFTCNIQSASFVNVIDTMFRKAGKEYAFLSKPNINLENMVYQDKDFNELLKLFLYQCNCDFTVQNNIYYIFEVQKKDIVKQFKETRIIQIKNINLDSLSAMFPNEFNAAGFIKYDKNSSSVILTGSPSEIKPIEEFISKIDVPVEGHTYKSYYLDNISAKDAVSAIPKSILISDIILLPSGNGFVTQVTGESEKVLNEYVNLLDNRKKNQAVKLKYIKSEELLKSLPPSVGKENITETSDPTVIFFTGTERQFEDFTSDLEQIDKPKQQIKYQLLVIQRQKNESFNWGTNLTVGENSGDAGYTWGGMLSNIFNINFDIIAKFGVQFAGSLNAELGNGKSRVLADTTLNGISGESLSFSNTNTYRYRDIIVDTKGDLYTSTTREITSGLTIAINGWVSGDGMITVKVDAQVSKQGSSESASSGNSADTSVPPSTTEKKVSTNVRTKSGEPVIIGGLFQQEEDISEKGVPLLGQIPVAGNLFKKRQTTVAESEFIIYLIPFVEESPEDCMGEQENLERLKAKYPETAE